MSRGKMRLSSIRICSMVGVLALVLWFSMSEGFIVSFAWLLLHKLMLGKIVKAYIFLSFLRLLKVLFLISGISLLAYTLLTVLIRTCAGRLVVLSEALERIVEKPARYLQRHFIVFVAILLAVIVLALCGPTLSFNFVSDDFGIIWAFHSQGVKIFFPESHLATHYSPVGLALLGLPWVAFGHDPFWLHLQCLLLHLANSFLVFFMCYYLTRRKTVCLVASLFFCTFYLNVEVLFWVTVGIFYGSMTLFLLTSFLCFVKYLNGGSTYYYWAFVAFYVLAQLTHEIAWAFLPVYLLYEVLYSPLPRHSGRAAGRIRTAASSAIKYFVPVAISLVTMGLKYFSGVHLMTAQLGRYSTALGARKLIEAFLYTVFSDNLTRIHLYRGELFLAGVGLVLLSIVIVIKSSREMKFFYFWGLFMLCTTTLFTGASRIAARHTYLPVAGFSVFFALLLFWVLERGSRLVEPGVFWRRDASQSDRQRVSGVVAILIGTIIVLVIVTKGISFMSERRAEWRRASDIVTNILRDIKTYYPEAPSESVAYFVNIPDSLGATRLGHAHVFRNGLRQALMMAYGKPFARAIHFRFTGSSPYPVVRASEPVSYEELDRLSSQPGVEVIFFSSEIGSVRRWPLNGSGKGTGASERSL